MIEIDGSYGEGGGQILRTGLALSALTTKPVKIFNIRANRPTPGLKRQHMVAIESVMNICNAEVKGLFQGSTTLEFYPGKLRGGDYSFDIGTAGSITLVLQACMLPSLFAEKTTRLSITGGTDVKWSPPWDYFRYVILPLLSKIGVKIDGYLHMRGYYPAGGGKAQVIIYPCDKIIGTQFPEEITDIRGKVNSANLPRSIAERMKKSAEK